MYLSSISQLLNKQEIQLLLNSTFLVKIFENINTFTIEI